MVAETDHPPGAIPYRPAPRHRSDMSESNGQPVPAAAEQDESSGITEKLMGAFGLIAAVGLALIAIDLLSGGAISRLVSRPAEEASSDGG